VGRITRARQKPKPKFVHEVRVGHWEVDQPWLVELVARVAGRDGFKKRTPFWAFYQYAVIWGLSTGLLREVVRVYRRERSNCSTHGLPRAVAAQVILAATPVTDVERAREMVDAMLTWAIARHGTWFWTGLQGDRVINRG
jgi:hypothetical protein